jgi:hypothetical protein
VFRLVVLHQLRVVDHLLFTHLALGFERFRTHAEFGLLILACVLFGVAFLRDSLGGTANHVDGWMDEVGLETTTTAVSPWAACATADAVVGGAE